MPNSGQSSKTICDHCGEVSLTLATWPQEVIDNCGCWCHLYRKGEWFNDNTTKRRKRKMR
jgi:hypothetical protein